MSATEMMSAAEPSRVPLAGRPTLNAAAAGGGDGVPVVFLNSLAADLSMWAEVVPHLGERRSLAFDARGHGRSDVVAGAARIEDFGDDALALMDAFGFERAVLCGLSLGGLAAMEVAARAPSRVAGFVLANTATSFPPAAMWHERATEARDAGLSALIGPTLERWLTQAFQDAHPAVAERVAAMIGATPAEGYAAACEALAATDRAEALSGYGGPVLILAGWHDRSTPVARAEEMVRLAPQATLHVLDCAHLSAIEAAPAFTKHLTAFLYEVDAAERAAG